MSREPYKYLDYYRFEDADLFFGREEEVQKMVGEILSTRLLVLFSPSGSGKTSLINAGVRPKLEDLGYQTVYSRFDPPVRKAVAQTLNLPSPDDTVELHQFLKEASQNVGKPLVIFLDQFEEFFIVFRDKQTERQQFILQLAKIRYDESLPVFIVLSLREDYFANLYEFREAIPSIFQNNANIHLEPFTELEARRAIGEPLKARGVEGGYEIGLVDRLIIDLKNGEPGIEPIKLQIVCHTLWEKRPSEAAQISHTLYEKSGGVEKILRTNLEDTLSRIPQRQQSLMARIFEALKTPENTKRYRTFNDIQQTLKLKRSQRLKRLLNNLANLQILRHEHRSGDDWYEFKHDYLVDKISKWLHERKERIQRKRLMYGIIPGVVLITCLLLYAIWQYSTFYASFTNPIYNNQVQEIVIARGFDPFNDIVTTGYDKNDIKNVYAENAIRNNYLIGLLNRNEWRRLAFQLREGEKGLFLYHIGYPEEAIDNLLENLKDKNWYVRSEVIESLGIIGEKDTLVINELLKILKDTSSSVRYQAAITLFNLGRNDQQVINVLLDAAKDTDSYDRYLAIDILKEFSKSDKENRVIVEFLETLKDTSSYMRYRAVAALEDFGKSDEQVINALIETLKDEYWNVRDRAATALEKLGNSDSRIINALLKSIDYPDPDVRLRIASILVNLGKSNDSIKNILIGALKNVDSSVRSRAIDALANINESDDKVIMALSKVLKDGNWDVRFRAAVALNKLGYNQHQVIVTLIEALKDADINVRSRAAYAFAELDIYDAKVVNILVMALKDEYWAMRTNVAETLVKLSKRDEKVIDALLESLKDTDWEIRSRVAVILGELGKSDDEQVINPLLEALNDTFWRVRSRMAIALFRLGKKDNQIINALLEALEDFDWEIRSQAAEALGTLINDDARVIVRLMEALKDDYEGVRSNAKAALGNSLKNWKTEALYQMLQSNYSGSRIAAIEALARQDNLLEEVRDKTEELKTDSRPWVRLAAWDAYNRILERIEFREKSKSLSKEADSLFTIAESLFVNKKYWEATNRYEVVFRKYVELFHPDSLEAARAKFQQARCQAKLSQLIPVLDNLETAFQYNPSLKDTLEVEIIQPNNVWVMVQGNWYLREVLLK